MKKMKIGILSKRKTMFTGKIKNFLENKGFTVTVYTLENLAINENLLNNDFYILKSKNLFFSLCRLLFRSKQYPSYSQTSNVIYTEKSNSFAFFNEKNRIIYS